MNTSNLIKTKQLLWAKRRQLALFSGSGSYEYYVKNLNDNLFCGSLSKETEKEILEADGNELNRSPSKMQALHSSSALGINLFEYWRNKQSYIEIAHACGLCSIKNKNTSSIKFEQKFVINSNFDRPPNLDVVIENAHDSDIKVYAIECKFTEPYHQNHSELSKKYINTVSKLWNKIPNTHNLAKDLVVNDNYKHLHRPQLIKHILGLLNNYGKSFRFLYLWYDAGTEAACKHRKEINEFKEVVEKDKIWFKATTYQEAIMNLYNNYYSGNEKYIDYLIERYL